MKLDKGTRRPQMKTYFHFAHLLTNTVFNEKNMNRCQRGNNELAEALKTVDSHSVHHNLID